MSFLKTMLISNGFGIILTYARRIIKTGKAEISHWRTIQHQIAVTSAYAPQIR